MAHKQPQQAPGRWRRAWRALREPAPAGEEPETSSDSTERHSRWRHLIDPGEPPLSIIRWLVVLGIALAWWANGSATSPLRMWLPYVVIAGAFTLPDIAGFAVGGLRVDMRKARDDIAHLQQDVSAQARSNAAAASIIAVGNDAFGFARQFLPPQAQTARDQASGAPVPWPPAGGGTTPSQDVPS